MSSSSIELPRLAPSTTAALSDIDLAQKYIGKSINELPTPAFVLDKSIIVKNITRLHTKINDPSITALLSAGASSSDGSSVERKLLFRPHVKTLKSEAVTRASLGYNIDGKPETEESNKLPKYHSVVASTIEEIRGLWPLVVEGLVNDIIYGVPLSQSLFSELCLLRALYLQKGADISLFVDDIKQLELFQDELALKSLESQLETEENVNLVKNLPKWKLVMKIDADEHRAGTKVKSDDFFKVLKTVTDFQPSSSETFKFGVELRGFYAHAGASYDANGNDVSNHLKRELSAVIDAAATARETLEKSDSSDKDSKLKFLLSIGATPTAHALSQPALESLITKGLHANDDLELHAGNFVALDLQQVSTGLVEMKDIAGSVLAQVVSYYDGRSNKQLPCCDIPHDNTNDSDEHEAKKQKKDPNNGPEYLLNAGVLALTREPPHGDGTKIAAARGLAQVKDYPNWAITRVSQEHGIVEYLGSVDGSEKSKDDEEEFNSKPWVAGQKIRLYPQHACITAAMHCLYFVVDGSDTIVNVWKPWKFW